MLGHKAKVFTLHTFRLEDLVPADNFYRHVEQCLDLRFVRDLVCGCYAARGRPSIDPIVFFKLQLIAFFEGIRSERQLMATVNVNLAHRWFIGYDLTESVPDHSSLSKIRERYGLATFQRFFEQIVERCIQAGLVWGEELYFDSTKVQANAAIDGLIPRVEWEAQQHLQVLFEAQANTAAKVAEPEAPLTESPSLQQPIEPATDSPVPQNAYDLVTKYNGARLTGVRKPASERLTDQQVCPTDPDAAPMKPSGGGAAVMGYSDHYVVDGGQHRIILSALVTPASIMDNTPLLDLVRWVCARWPVHPKQATGDTKYGTVPNIVGLEQMGIRAYVPITDLSHRTKFYPAERFQYQAEPDHYVCPQGQPLGVYSRRQSEQVIVYAAEPAVCNACPAKAECTDSQSGRHIFRSFFQEYLDRVKAYHETEAYQKAMRKRALWTEPLFGEAKQYHRLSRFRLRGLFKVNIEGVLIAAGQNLKRLLRYLETKMANTS